MRKLPVLTILFAASMVLSPVANAVAGDTARIGPGAPLELSRDCHPSYEGVCVPVASAVDCAGGNGNGPEYVSGPVYVVGEDVYELDRDGDGVACEPKG